MLAEFLHALSTLFFFIFLHFLYSMDSLRILLLFIICKLGIWPAFILRDDLLGKIYIIFYLFNHLFFCFFILKSSSIGLSIILWSGFNLTKKLVFTSRDLSIISYACLIYSLLLKPVHSIHNPILCNEYLLFIRFSSESLYFHILNAFEKITYNSMQFNAKNNEESLFLIWLNVNCSQSTSLFKK